MVVAISISISLSLSICNDDAVSVAARRRRLCLGLTLTAGMAWQGHVSKDRRIKGVGDDESAGSSDGSRNRNNYYSYAGGVLQSQRRQPSRRIYNRTHAWTRASQSQRRGKCEWNRGQTVTKQAMCPRSVQFKKKTRRMRTEHSVTPVIQFTWNSGAQFARQSFYSDVTADLQCT